MTQPPDWWSQLSPGIHNAPARAGGELILPFAWQQLEQIVQFFINAWLAKVAVALGAIEIFGWSPYAALVGLGQEFQAAKDNWDTIFAELSVGDISGLLNWLNNIPGEVINGITVIEQQILNAIAGALGHPAPPDATPSDILAYLQAFPADLITGAFNLGNVQIGTTSLDDIFNGTGQFIGVLNSAATGALNTALTVGGTSLSTLFTNINSSGELLLSGATGALNTAVTIGGQTVSTLATNWNAAVTDVNSLITGIGGSVIGDVTNYLQNVPNTAVQGLVGFGTNIGNSITALSDGVWQGLRAFLGIPTGVGPPQVSSAAQQVRTDLNNASDIATGAAAYQTQQAISKQSFLSIDPSADPVFPLSSISGASPTTVPIVQTKSVMGVILLPDASQKRSITWLGGPLTNISGVYVNLYKVDKSTGAFTRFHKSSNIIGSLSNPVSGVAWNFYNLPMADYFDVTLDGTGGTTTTVLGIGDYVVAELVTVGSGTYNVVGFTNGIPFHTTIHPKAPGASRTGLPSTLYSVAGAAASGNNTATVNETITLTTGDNAVYAAVVLYGAASTLSSVSATLGVTAMTLKSLSTDFLSSSANEYLAVFELIGTAGSGAFTTGAKTLAVTQTGLSGTYGIAIRSASYKNVSSSGAAQTASGSNTTLSQTVTGLTVDQVVFQAFAGAAASAGQTLSSYNQEVIAAVAAATSTNDCLTVGNALATSTSVSFTATSPASGWRGIAVPITFSTTPSAPPSSISSPNYDTATPWFALAGAAGRSLHLPETVEFETAGTFTYTMPSWIEDGDYIDVVPCGAGAGGSHAGTQGSTLNTAYKAGGAGSWNPTRLRYGDAYDIPTGTTTFTVNVGAGGAGAGSPALNQPPVQGSDGGNTTVVITGHPTITANKGLKDSTTQTEIYLGVYYKGDSPGNVVHQGITYFGGAPSTNVGNSPGAGGRAGIATTSGGSIPGYDGAPGACYITAVQNS